MMSKKEATTSGMVVTGTLFLNSMPFCVLVDLGATHSFIFNQFAIQLDPEHVKVENNYRIKLSNDSIFDCPILYKHAPIFIVNPFFLGI